MISDRQFWQNAGTWKSISSAASRDELAGCQRTGCLRKFQEKAHNKNFRFTLTTNGVLLNDEVQEFVNKEMDNVVLSLDGRKEVNDKMRPFRNGKGSYDLIVPKFQKLAESRNQEKYYIRGTFTRNNLDFSKDVLHFADLGFEQVSIEPVVGEDTDPYAIQKEDLPQIFEEYDRLAKMIIDREKRAEEDSISSTL